MFFVHNLRYVSCFMPLDFTADFMFVQTVMVLCDLLIIIDLKIDIICRILKQKQLSLLIFHGKSCFIFRKLICSL